MFSKLKKFYKSIKGPSLNSFLVILVFMVGAIFLPYSNHTWIPWSATSFWGKVIQTVVVALIEGGATFAIFYYTKSKQYANHLILARKRLSPHGTYQIMTPREARPRIVEECLTPSICIAFAAVVSTWLMNSMSLTLVNDIFEYIATILIVVWLFNEYRRGLSADRIKASKGTFTFYRSDPDVQFPNMLRIIPHSDMIPKQAKEKLHKEDKKAK